MLDMLSSVIDFPTGSGIQGLVLTTMSWIYSWMGNYGLTVIFFAIMLRLVLLPIDFGTQYFTKRNSLNMARMRPQLADLTEKYGHDPVAMNRARGAMMRQQGSSLGGFCFFTILNIVLMFLVFINVFQGMNAIANHNINHQFTRLQEVHAYHEQNGTLVERRTDENGYYITDDDGYYVYVATEEFIADINAVHAHYNTRFAWVANIWRPDTPWTSRTISFGELRGAMGGTGSSSARFIRDHEGNLSPIQTRSVDNEGNYQLDIDGNYVYTYQHQWTWDELRDQHEFIFDNIDGAGRRWNGFLILVLLSGGSVFLSIWIGTKFNKASKKMTEPEAKKEEVISYSVRGNTASPDGKQPQKGPDPDQMGKMMKFIMPVVMMFVGLSFTAALALYMVASSLIQVGVRFGFNPLIERLIKKGDEKRKAKNPENGPDMTIINPHARYIKQ